MPRAPDSSYAQTLRVLRLLARAAAGPWTVAQMASHLGVAARTVRRDLAALRAHGWPVAHTPLVGGAQRCGRCPGPARATAWRCDAAGVPACGACLRPREPAPAPAGAVRAVR